MFQCSSVRHVVHLLAVFTLLTTEHQAASYFRLKPETGLAHVAVIGVKQISVELTSPFSALYVTHQPVLHFLLPLHSDLPSISILRK